MGSQYMNGATIQRDPRQNQLLAALSERTYLRIEPFLEPVSLSLGKVLYESGAKLHYAYFPVDSIISLVQIMSNGASLEISVVGREGLTDVSMLMGSDNASNRAVVQRGGTAYRLASKKLKDEFDHRDDLTSLLLRYTQSLITQVKQIAVCNRHHSINQQLCRWLLLLLDRLPGNQIVMTQELIANMLGVRREGVTEAAGNLQKLGIIEYKRGRISVLDRTKLERFSCECYEVTRLETERLLPYTCKHPQAVC